MRLALLLLKLALLLLQLLQLLLLLLLLLRSVLLGTQQRRERVHQVRGGDRVRMPMGRLGGGELAKARRRHRLRGEHWDTVLMLRLDARLRLPGRRGLRRRR